MRNQIGEGIEKLVKQIGEEPTARTTYAMYPAWQIENDFLIYQRLWILQCMKMMQAEENNALTQRAKVNLLVH